jgi:hypothetical protein
MIALAALLGSGSFVVSAQHLMASFSSSYFFSQKKPIL